MRFLLLFFITIASLLAMEEKDFYINGHSLASFKGNKSLVLQSEMDTTCGISLEDKKMKVLWGKSINPSDITHLLNERIEKKESVIICEQNAHIKTETFESILGAIKSKKGSINLNLANMILKKRY